MRVRARACRLPTAHLHVLTGGGALLRALPERLTHETGMPIIVAENSLEAVVLGSGKCVEEFEALQQVLVPEPRR